jgi:hypothetical protein
MGKAIIFKGVVVSNPLQTVNFPLNTAAEYSSAYLVNASSAASKQTELNTFIQTLMDNGIWDKTSHCYPILGGITEYYYDLKAVSKQNLYGAWRSPASGTTWDATRNCINLSLPGNAIGVPMIFDNLSRTSSCFIASLKNQRVNVTVASSSYAYTKDPSYLTSLSMKKGGYQSFAWSTPHLDASTAGYSSAINGNYIFTANFNNGTTVSKFAQDSATLIAGGTQATSAETAVQFAIGNFFSATATAPANDTLHGSFNFFMAFNSSLTDAEQDIATQAIYDFNESCGRHTDF